MREGACDVAILGGGAAGLMAAIRAAERGRRAIVVERNRQPGIKILISGGTRCNVTNATTAGGIVEAFGPNGRFLWPALGALDPEGVVRFFREAGLATKVEDDVVPGKVFPASDRAADVLAALLGRLERAGGALLSEARATALRATSAERGFEIETSQGRIHAARVIVTTGGLSYPRSGTSGDGYGFARAFGHAIVEPRPALVPLVIDEPWVRALRGISVPRARVRGFVAGRSPRGTDRRGAVLFTHFGLSGPVVLDLSSRLVRVPGYPAGAAVEIDFLPDVEAGEIDSALRPAAGGGARLVKHGLTPAIPERLAEALVAAVARIPPERRLAGLARDERRRLVAAVKATRLPVRGDRGFSQAEVTSGGVDLDEIDPRTLESRHQPGLHFAGEVLDLDGPIGGFNFQAAWSTGWLAGSVV